MENRIYCRKALTGKIAEKIEYLMDHPEQCTAMGKAGKEKFLKEFTLDKFENRMKEILMDCVTSI